VVVLGVNLGTTRCGKRLRDGGACLADPAGPIVAIAEERISRRKHDGGVRLSVPYCLDYAGLGAEDVELCIATSCCEAIRDPNSVAELAQMGIDVQTISHHLAHAYSAFWPSRFDEALVIVLDSGGNTLGRDYGDGAWWTRPREQATYYIAAGGKLEIIARDFDRPYEAGFGELFRAVTHYLGWPSSTYAGNTMALAALGHNLATRPIYAVEDGRLTAPLDVNPHDPVAMVAQLLTNLGVQAPPPRRRGEGITQELANLARLLQDSFYSALRWRVENLVKRTGIRRVCFAGGVALNCVALGRLLSDSVVDEIFVQPAAGDTGQCLGAAYAGLNQLDVPRPRLSESIPFLGRHYSDVDVAKALQLIDRSGREFDVVEGVVPAVQQLAEQLASGSLVAWFSGRSEFGPRALGARSILADPRSEDARKRLLLLKERDTFMPFAPSILATEASTYFVGTGSATMTLTVQTRPEICTRVPAVVHADGSARVQLVQMNDSAFQLLIQRFYIETGVPMLLNTSLNLAGDPIAETPYDCASMFLRSDLDCLFLDGTLVVKR
jgi:carbamoyltransferase